MPGLRPTTTPKMPQIQTWLEARVASWRQKPDLVRVSSDVQAVPIELQRDMVRLKVLCAGVHNVVRARAKGEHYSAKELPHCPGVDGVGVLPDGDGTMYYFVSLGGTFRQYIDIAFNQLVPLPHGLKREQAAALVNPALSTWMALHTRLGSNNFPRADIPKDFTILILGATSQSGRLAAQLTRVAGGANVKVVGACRSQVELNTSPDFDDIVQIHQDDIRKTDFTTGASGRALGTFDIILDFIYGSLTEHLFASLPGSNGREIEYVQLGQLGGADSIAIPGHILRSKNIAIQGSGPGSWSMKTDLPRHLPALLEALVHVSLAPVELYPLTSIHDLWDVAPSKRLPMDRARIVFDMWLDSDEIAVE